MQSTDYLDFERGHARWSREHDSVEFNGKGPRGPVSFMITGDVLAEMLQPDGALDLDGEDAELTSAPLSLECYLCETWSSPSRQQLPRFGF